MLTPPDGLSDDLLVATLAGGWGLEVASIRYLPVGFGSHHWLVIDVAAAQWFVTVDDLVERRESLDEPPDAAFARLRSALAAATDVLNCGCGFVVAPVPTTDGEPLLRMTERFAAAVYRYVEGRSFPWGEFEDAAHRRGVVALLVGLHTAPAAAWRQARVDDYAIPLRDELVRVLDSAAHDGAAGPFALRTSRLLARQAAPIRRLLAHYDQLVAETRTLSPAVVLTHGEPHPGNTMLTADGWRLIDWDTALVAPPERDLWVLEPGDGSVLAGYAEATGVTPRQATLDLYRLRWDLTELAMGAGRLCSPHVGNEDDAKTWQELRSLVTGLR